MPRTLKLKAKICVVGEGGVGKTSLIRRFAFDEFDDKYLKTVGTKVTKIPLIIPRSEGFEVDVDMVLFDIMGQRGFRDMVKDTFFIGAQGLVAVCDLTNPATLEGLHDWITIATEVTGSVPVFLVANKADLERQVRVTAEAIQDFSTIHNAPAFRTSARTKAGVEEAFNLMAVEIVDRVMREQEVRGQEENLYVRILAALDRRGAMGMNKREFFDAFPGIAYGAVEGDLLRLEKDGLIGIHWMGPEDFRATLTAEGREELQRAGGGELPDLPQNIQ